MAYIDKFKTATARHLEAGEQIDAAARGMVKGFTKYGVIGAIVGFVPSYLIAQSAGYGFRGPAITALGVGFGVAIGYMVGARVLGGGPIPPIFTMAVTGSRFLVFERDFWGRVTDLAAAHDIRRVKLEVGRGAFLSPNPGTVTINTETYAVVFPKMESLEPLTDALG